MAGNKSGGAAAGGALLAGVMMILLGLFHAIEGLIGLLNSDFYATQVNKNFLSLNASTWSWTHLVVGVAVALVGLAVLSGASWGRIVGIMVIFISAVGNFLFIPYYPIWSIFLLALDIFIIWSLATWEPEEIS